jgi:hypothetical protein
MYSWTCCRAWNMGCCKWNMAVSIALESELPSTWHIVARGIWNEQLLQPSSHPYATAPHEGLHTLLPSFLQPSLFHNKSKAMYVTKTLSSSLSLSLYRIEVLFPKFSLCLSLTGICGDPPPPSVTEAIWWSQMVGSTKLPQQLMFSINASLANRLALHCTTSTLHQNRPRSKLLQESFS